MVASNPSMLEAELKSLGLVVRVLELGSRIVDVRKRRRRLSAVHDLEWQHHTIHRDANHDRERPFILFSNDRDLSCPDWIIG